MNRPVENNRTRSSPAPDTRDRPDDTATAAGCCVVWRSGGTRDRRRVGLKTAERRTATRRVIVRLLVFVRTRSGRDKWPLCYGCVWRALWTRWRRGHCRATELRVFPLVCRRRRRRRRRSASRVPSAAARRPDAGARRGRTRHVTTRRRRESYARRTLAAPPLPYGHPPAARGRTTFVFLPIPRASPSTDRRRRQNGLRNPGPGINQPG